MKTEMVHKYVKAFAEMDPGDTFTVASGLDDSKHTDYDEIRYAAALIGMKAYIMPNSKPGLKTWRLDTAKSRHFDLRKIHL